MGDRWRHGCIYRGYHFTNASWATSDKNNTVFDAEKCFDIHDIKEREREK